MYLGRLRPLLALALLLGVGCVGERTNEEGGDDRASTALGWGANATRCARVFTAVFVERAHAASLLPEGYVAGDSAGFFGVSGAPTGRGIVAVDARSCAGSEAARGEHREATVGVFLEPPERNGAPAEGANFYELARALPVGDLMRRYEQMGWSLVGSEVDVTSARQRVEAASARVGDGEGELLRISGDAGAYEDSFSESVRWWHETAGGIGIHEASFTLTGFLGPGRCEARAGAIFAEAIGAGVCPPGTLVLSGPPFDIEERFTFTPRGESP